MKKPIRILLINTINIASEAETKYFPLGLEYLASYLLKYLKEKPEIKLIEADIENHINKFKPDIVGVSSTSQNFNRAKEIAAYCKKKDIFVIAGGIHISMIAESLDKNMDVAVLYEGEETLLEIIRIFQKKGISRKAVLNVKGIAYLKDNKLHINPPREFISPLDKIPNPRRDLSPKQSREVYMFSSRGCPYRCVFCASSRYWKTVRFFSAEYVINEINEIMKNTPGITRINFYDDLFIADKKRLRELTRLIEKEGINKKLAFTISVRSELVNKEVVDLLKKMNVTIVNMGLESGLNKTLGYLKGGFVSVQVNQKAINLFKQAGMQVSASFIIGSPKETRSDMLKTLEFIKKSKLDLFDVYVLVPFPGTPVWDYALEKNLVSNNMDWNKLEIDFAKNHEEAIILSEKVDREELYEIYQMFQKEKKNRYLKLMIKSGLKRPKDILPFIFNKIKFMLKK